MSIEEPKVDMNKDKNTIDENEESETSNLTIVIFKP